MSIKDGIKAGFGLAIGYLLGSAAIRIVGRGLMKSAAKDEKWMEGLKTRNPKLYEEMKQYVDIS